MKKFIITVVLVISSLSVPSLAAEDNPVQASSLNTIYAHAWRGDGNTDGGGGFIHQSKSMWVAGIDFGIEGEREDYTYGNRTTEKGWSVNIIGGINPFTNKKYSAALFGLLGARSIETTCPSGQSNLGFRCYADFSPEDDYKVNYGGGTIINIKRVALGFRITGESKTAILGFNF